MQGFSPKLPLSKDVTDGLYSMNKTALESIHQDFKMLLLTNPGERMMIPDYGVGLRAMLFSQDTPELSNFIRNQVNNQVAKFMDFITVTNIEISTDQDNENAIGIKIEYYVPSLNTTQEINLALGSN
jgi:phage baseplate assembly protein W